MALDVNIECQLEALKEIVAYIKFITNVLLLIVFNPVFIFRFVPKHYLPIYPFIHIITIFNNPHILIYGIPLS